LSGIFGFINQDGKPADLDVLKRMGALLRHRGQDGEYLWQRGEVGLGCELLRTTSLTESQPVTGNSGSILLLDGRLDDREEALSQLGLSPDCSDPEFAISLYERFGEEFTEHLVGDFAVAIYDPRQRQLLLARDGMGAKPLYYTLVNRTLVFASEMKGLLAHPDVPAKQNEDKLAEFMLGGLERTEAQETFLAGVFSVLPAHLAVFRNGNLSTRQYWDFDVRSKIRAKSFDECAENFRDLLDRAVRRRLRGPFPIAISLSGGLDSSSVYCLAERTRRQDAETAPALLPISYVDEALGYADERQFLTDIENQYGVKVQRIPVRFGEMEGAVRSVWAGEIPFLHEFWQITADLCQTARQAGARRVLDGHYGDQVLIDQEYLVDLFRKGAFRAMWRHILESRKTYCIPSLYAKQVAKLLLRHHLPRPLRPWLRYLRGQFYGPARDMPWFTEQFRRRSLDRHTRHVSEHLHFSSLHARSLYEEVRSRLHIMWLERSEKATAMYGLEEAHPFRDRELVAFLMAIPGEIQMHDGVPKAILRAGLRGILPDTIANRTGKADATAWTQLVIWSASQKIASLVQNGASACAGYLNPNVVKEQLKSAERHLKGGLSAEYAWRISDVLGLELWLRQFVEHSHREATAYATCDESAETL
jgi:asparagine synthase (glutamine-hydrolysing)